MKLAQVKIIKQINGKWVAQLNYKTVVEFYSKVEAINWVKQILGEEKAKILDTRNYLLYK